MGATATSQAPVRLAELLGALSVATDHVAGQPPESALSACTVAMRLSRCLGVEADALPGLYYAALLRFLGCTSTAAEAASLGGGQDGDAFYAVTMADWLDPAQFDAALDRYFGHDLPGETRAAAMAALREAQPGLPGLAGLHCLQAQVLARRLPVPEATPGLLSHVHQRWDGQYGGVGGEDVPLAERIVAVAVVAELMRRAAGAETAIELLSLRAGKQLDPEVCRCAQQDAGIIFAGLDGAGRWEHFLEAEPGEPLMVGAHGLGEVALACADFSDQKSPFLAGHSRRVAGLSFLAAEQTKLDDAQRQTLRLAGLLHDVGRTSVPNGVWDKPDTLSPIERQKAEGHSLSTDQILALAPSVAAVRELAAATHERGDGHGYHRRQRLADGDAATGILAAADVYDALTHERPWREAYDATTAADMLLGEARAGKLPRAAVGAVLEAAGAGKRTAERAYPDGLTRREVDVLELIARGHTTKVVAARLGISPKTADHHIQRVYDKCGVRGRAAVALYALEQGIVQE